MKKISFFLSLSIMLISGYTANAQCTFTGDLNFTTQAQLDAWSPPCSQITVTGFVNVQGSTITDISKLQNIVQVGSYLQLKSISPIVTSISSLSNITSVGGTLVIRDCDGLTSIAPLGGLTSLGGAIIIRDNLNLTSLNGLGNLINPPLTGGITIYNNTALSDISAINYGIINGLLEINSNPALTSLGTLSSITNITGLLKITLNNSLANINDLTGLTSVGGNVEITSNNALTSISGLSSLTSAGGSLYVRTNPLLSNLTGLDNLTSLGAGASIDVKDNTILKSFCGLNALVASGNFTTYVVTGNGYNPLLSNFPTACQDLTNTTNYKSFEFLSYPNPVNNQLNICIDREATYALSNLSGQKVMVGSLTNGENSINASNITTGMYILEISDLFGLKYSAKILKE